MTSYHPLLIIYLGLLFSSFYGTLCIETVLIAARNARQLVDSSEVGTLATVYPHTHPTLAGEPFALPEYYASCHSNGSLTILFLPISQNNRNILASPKHAASISVQSSPAIAANARIALIGTMVLLPEGIPEDIIQCYIAHHPDAAPWIPGRNGPHIAIWARFDPHTVYYVGGFGNEHFIGKIPLMLYKHAGKANTSEEVLVASLRVQGD